MSKSPARWGKPHKSVTSRNPGAFISPFHLLLRNYARFGDFLWQFPVKIAELFRFFPTLGLADIRVYAELRINSFMPSPG